MVTLKKSIRLKFCPNPVEFGALDDKSESLTLTEISHPTQKVAHLIGSKSLKIWSFWVTHGIRGKGCQLKTYGTMVSQRLYLKTSK